MLEAEIKASLAGLSTEALLEQAGSMGFRPAAQLRETEALGYRPVFTVEKLRREYRLEDVTLCLDEVTGLGAYLELETLAPSEEDREDAVNRLLTLLDRLGVSRDRLTRHSYLELLTAGNGAGH